MKKNFLALFFLLAAFCFVSVEAKAQFNLGKIKQKAKEVVKEATKTGDSNSSQNNLPGTLSNGESAGGNWNEYKNNVLEQIKTVKQDFNASGVVEASVLDKTGFNTDDDASKWFLNLNYATDSDVQKEAKERLLGMYNIYNPTSEAQSIPANVLQEIETAANDFRAAVIKAGAGNKFSEIKPSTVNKEANAVKTYLTANKNIVFKVIEKKSWEINKNELGIPNYRQKTLVVHYKPAGANYCVERGAVVRENYSGGGTYETSNPDVVMWATAKLVGCQ